MPTRRVWQPGRRGFADSRRQAPLASYVDLARRTLNLADLMFAELRRRRRPSARSVGPLVPFTTPLALLGLLFIPAVVAMYLLKLRRDETIVPVDAAVDPARCRRRGQCAVAEAAAQPAAAPAAAAGGDPRTCWRRGRSSSARPGLARDIVVVVDTSASMGATDVVAGPAGRRPRRRRSRRCKRPADRRARSASSPPTGAPGSWSTRRPTSGGSGRRSTATRDDRARTATSATRSSSRRSSPRALGRRPDPRRDRWRARDRRRRRKVDAPDQGPARRVASARTRPSSRSRSGPSPSSVTRSVFISVANLDLERAARRLEVWGDGSPARGARRRLLEAAGSFQDVDDRRRARATSATLEVQARRRGTRPSTGAPDQLARRRPRRGRSCRPTATRLDAGRGCRATRISRRRSAYLPNVELFGVTARGVRPGERSARTGGRGTW